MSKSKTPLRTEHLIDILGIIVLFAFVIARSPLLFDPGIGWHLRTGEWVVKNHAVPHTDPFLESSQGKLWICNQWLADVVLWGMYSIGGGAALQLLSFIICLAPFIVLAPRWARKYDCSAPAVCLGLLVAMGLGAVQWYVRPFVFGFFLFGCCYGILMHVIGQRRMGTAFITLPPLFAVWSNMHPSFPLGLLLIGCAALDQAFRAGGVRLSRLLALLLLACGAATIVNPFGFELYRSAAGLISNDYFMNLNTEWWSPNFHNPVFYPLLLMLTVYCFASFNRPALSLFERLVFAIFVCLGLRSGRYVPFLGMAAVTPLITIAQAALSYVTGSRVRGAISAFTSTAAQPRIPVGVISGCSALVLGILVLKTHELPGWTEEQSQVERKFPQQISDILAAAPPRSKLFHTPDWGGFITFSLWPRQRAFIDDRNELNGQRAYEDFWDLQKLHPNWREVLTKYNFNFMVVEKKAALYSGLTLLPEWHNDFENDAVALFEHASSNPPNSSE